MRYSRVLSPADKAQLQANLAGIRARIAAACARAGRDPAEVALVAVTKYSGVAYAQALVELGQVDLGENRVDHLLELAAEVKGARWHMIGHLQRNKANKVADVLTALHSLDSLELARKLDARRSADLAPLEVYVEIRLDPAAQRSGIEAAQLPELLEGLRGLTRLHPVGLMGLPPLGPPEDAREHFAGLRGLQRGAPGLSGLSMGMTSDLEVAIEEGATVVRVGRALLEGLTEGARTP
jgi:hypothetical protein